MFQKKEKSQVPSKYTVVQDLHLKICEIFDLKERQYK